MRYVFYRYICTFNITRSVNKVCTCIHVIKQTENKRYKKKIKKVDKAFLCWSLL